MPVIGNHLGINARHGRFRTFTVQQVEARKSRGGGHNDILTKLLTMNKAKPLEMDDNGVLSMAASNVFAGSDTTAISMRAILYYLCKNPKCKEKLVQEIDEQTRSGQISIPPTVQQAKGMPYLQACLQEALRLYPAVGMNLKRVTPPGGIQVDRFHLPEGVSFSSTWNETALLTLAKDYCRSQCLVLASQYPGLWGRY